jgi:DNA-damage-inducible protein D
MSDEKQLGRFGSSPFDSIRRIDSHGVEYWTSRDLARELAYVDYRDFADVVAKAKLHCQNSGEPVANHFVDVPEMVAIGSGAERPIDNTWLTRYGCYLVALSADSSKPVVGIAKTYFAIQTRRQEIEDDTRLLLRERMKKHNSNLAWAAKAAGVIEPRDFAIFQNFGYKGLYNETMQKIHQRKGLKSSQAILDHMGSTELAANLFRATQTEEKIRNEGIVGKDKANQAHEDVGRRVRQTMRETGGTMPEDLPTVDSIKKLEAAKRKQLKTDGNSDQAH